MEDKFIDLYENGNLKEAKLLYEQHKMDINNWNDQAFRLACRDGQLETAKWLYSVGANIHARNDCAFRIACYNGQLETAKWLHSLDANIHAENDYAFKGACFNGHLETAKWLYDVGADIHACNDYAFRYACRDGHFKVIDWLLTIGDFDVKDILNSYNCSSEIEKLLKQHLEYKLKWCNLFGFNKECTKKFSDIYDNSKKEYSKTFDDMFPFSKVKN